MLHFRRRRLYLSAQGACPRVFSVENKTFQVMVLEQVPVPAVLLEAT